MLDELIGLNGVNLAVKVRSFSPRFGLSLTDLLLAANRRPRIRGSPVLQRTPSIKYNSSTPSKGTPRRLYGPASTVKPSRSLRPWTPPQRPGSATSDASTSALLTPVTDSMRRRAKGGGSDIFRDHTTKSVRRYSDFERPAVRMDRLEDENEDPLGGTPNRFKRESKDLLEIERDERGYRTLSGSEDEAPVSVAMKEGPPKAVVPKRPLSSAGPFGGSLSETPFPSPPLSDVTLSTSSELPLVGAKIGGTEGEEAGATL